MQKFRYSARDKDGKLIQGTVDHIDREEAVAGLQARGLVVVSIAAQKKRSLVAPSPKKMRYRLKSDDLALFCRQLATLLNAGVALLRSLSIVLRQTDCRPLYNTIDKIRIDVEEGHSLHDAMASHPKIFSALWVAMVETGETSGQLASTFEHLATYLEKTGSAMRKVRSAMIYPAILLSVCIVAILIFTLRIIPMFGEVYKGFNIELPLLTLGVLNLSNFMRKYLILVILLGAGIFFALRALVKTQPGRYAFDVLKLKIPLFGTLIHSMIIERFSYTLGTLIKSGIPILSGLDIVGNSCGNKIFQNVIEQAKDEVKAGKTMSELFESSGLFPSLVTQMMKVGEETGKLGEMFDRITLFYQEKTNTMVDRMTAAFEPIMLIFLGITVGILVIAMYLPIFKIATGGTPQ